MKLLVYGLIDPRNGQLKYVGLSRSGLVRPRAHWVVYKERTRNCAWVACLRKLGLKYEIEVLQECDTEAELIESEQFWIAYFTSVGCDLNNHTLGGDGGPRGGKHTSETRAKISAAMKGRVKSAAHRKALSVSCLGMGRGQRLSDEHKARIAAGLRRTHADR